MTLTVKREEGKIFSHIRQKWLVETPEERVRQEYLCILVNEYGSSLDQIAEEENLTGRGSAQARADFVIWRTAQDKAKRKPPLIVVECKSDNVTIAERDYARARTTPASPTPPSSSPTTTARRKFWRVPQGPDAQATWRRSRTSRTPTPPTRRSKNSSSKLKVFKEDEFADLLHQCHNVIRNRENLDPAAAFDEIAKILFVKVCVERELQQAKRRARTSSPSSSSTSSSATTRLNDLFEKTKEALSRPTSIFDADENDQPQARHRPRDRPAAGDATTSPTPARTSRASPSSASWAAPSAARSASSSRRAPSSNSWSSMVDPQGRRRHLRPGQRLRRLPHPLLRDRARSRSWPTRTGSTRSTRPRSRPTRSSPSRSEAELLRDKYDEHPGDPRPDDDEGSRLWTAGQPLHLRHRRQRPHGPHQQDEHDHARRRPRRRASPQWLPQRQRHLRGPLRHHPDQSALRRQRRAVAT